MSNREMWRVNFEAELSAIESDIETLAHSLDERRRDLETLARVATRCGFPDLVLTPGDRIAECLAEGPQRCKDIVYRTGVLWGSLHRTLDEDDRFVRVSRGLWRLRTESEAADAE